jgi:hypothetical protein
LTLRKGNYCEECEEMKNEMKNEMKDKVKNERTNYRFRIRIGHCGLNNYLYRFGKSNSPCCNCGYGKETVEHFILECPNYRMQRKELRKMVGIWKMRIDKLLGDIRWNTSGQPKEWTTRQIWAMIR